VRVTDVRADRYVQAKRRICILAVPAAYAIGVAEILRFWINVCSADVCIREGGTCHRSIAVACHAVEVSLACSSSSGIVFESA
jgi:hypothetical protein